MTQAKIYKMMTQGNVTYTRWILKIWFGEKLWRLGNGFRHSLAKHSDLRWVNEETVGVQAKYALRTGSRCGMCRV